MKACFAQSIALTGTLLFCTAILPSHAGVIDILRGEPAAPQRVAFVGSAEVKTVTGKVMRLSGIDRWTELSQGAKLAPGDMIRSEDGNALLQMTESGSFIKITPNTVLRLVPIERTWDPGVLTGREEKSGFIVRSCRGSAFIEKTGRWEPVEVNTVLARGTQVRTAPGSSIDLFDTQLRQAVRIQGPVRLTLDENLTLRPLRTAPSLASATR